MVGVLLASAVIAPQAADADVSGSVDGTYQFNANGWSGTLTVIDAEDYAPTVIMTYDELGSSETMIDTSWSPQYGVLTFIRILSNGVAQSYELYEGSHVAGSPVFGGNFIESDLQGMAFGVFADDFLPLLSRPHGPSHSAATTAASSVPSAVTAASAKAPAFSSPLDWPDLDGMYDFNGNGWTGKMLIAENRCADQGLEAVHLNYDEIGTWEAVPGALFNPFTNQITFTRTLSDGITQTYQLWLGTHVSPAVEADGYYPASPMLGGYFTESDTGTQRYAAFASYDPPGLGC
ncbi:MAG TPA: hypothetical protein VGX23_16685 [Actinocrinis sp.]|nr:hypothetical protein [Actinocrinis sp.]